MKKGYLLLPAFLIGTAFAQQNAEGPTTPVNRSLNKAQYEVRENLFNGGDRVPGAIIQSEDFADPFNNGWTTTGDGSTDQSIAPSQLWLWTDQPPQGYFSQGTSAINSATQANGFMILDGDYTNGLGQPPSVVNEFHAELVSPVYDLSTVANGTNVSIKFDQSYRNCCAADVEMYVDVTTDGFANVVTFDMEYQDAPTNTASGTRTRYINVTNIYQADPANFQVRFRWGNPGAGTANNSHYFWMIDDFAVFETWEYHGVMNDVAFSADTTTYGTYGGFQKIPAYAAANTDLYWTATFENIGSMDWVDGNLQVDQDGSSFAMGTPAAVPAGTSTDLFTARAAMPTAEADYVYTLYGTSASPFNIMDTTNLGISVTSNTYATGGDVYMGRLSKSGVVEPAGSATLGFGGEIVLTYGEPEVINGINVTLYDTVFNEFAPMQAIIEVDGDVVATQNFTVDNALLGQAQYVPFDNPVQLNGNAPGTIDDTIVDYLVVGSDLDPVFQMSGDVAYHIGLRAYYDAAGARTGFYLEEPNMMDMVVAPGFVSVEENNGSLNSISQNIPNPFDNNTIINYTLANNEMVTFEVVDITGKVVKTVNLGSRGAGQHQIELNANEFNKGIYFYSVTAGDSKMTKKMVVLK